MKKILFSLLLASALLPLSAQTPDWKEVLTKVDNLSTFDNNDFSAEVTVVTTKPGEANDVIQARYFRRDANKQFVMLILKPEVQKGQGYLAIDDNLWFYDPESRKFAFSSLKDRFSDSGANNSDFSNSKLAVDYSVVSATEEKLGKFDTWALVLKATSNTVPVAKRKLWIRRDNYLVLKDEQYSLSDRLMRTVAIPNYQSVTGKFVPMSMLIIDNIKVGEKTQVTFKDPSVSKLPDTVFSKAYLERVNN